MIATLFGVLLVFVFVRWCLVPVVTAILRVVDPDEEDALQVEIDEISRRVARSDARMTEGMNEIRGDLSLHRVE